jgi:hypothetical protein
MTGPQLSHIFSPFFHAASRTDTGGILASLTQAAAKMTSGLKNNTTISGSHFHGSHGGAYTTCPGCKVDPVRLRPPDSRTQASLRDQLMQTGRPQGPPRASAPKQVWLVECHSKMLHTWSKVTSQKRVNQRPFLAPGPNTAPFLLGELKEANKTIRLGKRGTPHSEL